MILGCLAMAASVVGAVQTNTVNNGVSNWNLKASYSDGRIPSEGDVVLIPDGATVTVNGNDADSCRIVSKLGRLVPEGRGSASTIVFDIPSGVAVTNDSPIFNQEGYGAFVKRGGGDLVLNSKGQIATSANSRRDYYVKSLTIEAGSLRLPQGVPMGEYVYGCISVAKDATLYLSYYKADTSTSTAYFHSFIGLTGEGDVVYDGPVPSGKQEYFRVEYADCTFAGRILGACGIYPGGRILLTGTNSTMTLPPVVFGNKNKLSADYGTIGLKKIGNAGEESSVGISDTLSVGYRGGGYLYLGTGETTDKKIVVSSENDEGAAFFDAGTTGGITFLNTWTYSPSTTPRMFDFVLMGTNARPCTIAGQIKDWKVGTTNLAFYITKKGSGAWHFTDAATHKWYYSSNTWIIDDNSDMFWSGGLGVEDGTIQFDSLEETNVVCSLGFGRILQTPYRTKYDVSKNVDYAYVLGDTNAIGVANTEGALEYLGTNGVVVGTRRMVLKGNGRLSTAADTARFRYAGVSALTSGHHTLMLDGAATNGNEILDVVNGAGTVSVVKEGLGTWAVGGRSSFTGALSVNAGTLNVKPASTNYTWFLFRVKKLVAGASGFGSNAILQLAQFGLFDADGNRLGENLLYKDKYWEVDPGTIAFGTRDPVAIDGTIEACGPQQLFNFGDTITVLYAPRKYSWALDPDDPEKWITILFRLPEGSSSVASYDIVASYDRTNTNANRNPRTFSLHGSTDGIHWDLLDEVTDILSDDESENHGFHLTTAGKSWMHSDEVYVRNAVYTKGRPISGCSTQPAVAPAPSSLSVAGGATLNVTGMQLVLSKLEIDATVGFGSVNGCRFASTGEITVTGVEGRSKEVVLGDVPTGVADFANVLEWSLSVNGDTTPNYVLVIAGGKLKLVKKGLMIVVR